MGTAPICGIYLVKNAATGRVYVGRSKNVKQRWAGHRAGLRNGSHECHLMRADAARHGAGSFAFEVLETTDDPADLGRLEQKWIDALGSDDPERGYNAPGVRVWREPPPPRPKTVDHYRLLALLEAIVEAARGVAEREGDDPALRDLRGLLADYDGLWKDHERAST